jgi:hypothetical protein
MPRLLLELGVLLAAATTCSAFTPLHRSPRALRPLPLATTTSTALRSTAVAADLTTLQDEVVLTKLFGRLADKLLLCDVPGAGTVEMMNCCHGGCDNCDFARVFDEYRAAKAKWVAHYNFLEHPDGRTHRPPWASAIFGGDAPDGADASAVGSEEFVEKLTAMPYGMTMGPMKSVPADESDLPPAAAAAFFDLLTDGAAELTADVMGKRLTELTGKDHGCLWRDFKNVAAASA